MARRVILHIGVQKSGTTYLQQMMQDRVRELAQVGVLYPVPTGRRAKSGRVNHHEVATYGLLGSEFPWVDEERAIAERGWWETLQKEVREWRGTAIVSAEALSVIRSEAAQRTIEAFGVPENTDVYITGRSLGKLLPSAWQQFLRNGRSKSFGSYLHRLAEQRETTWELLEKDPDMELWRAFALGRLAHRWASIVGTGRVTMIANPGSPPDRLWRRFIEAIALEDTSGIRAPDAATTVHRGVTAAEADVLGAINSNLASAGWPRPVVKQLDNRIIRAFAARDQRGPGISIDKDFREQVENWSREDIDDLGRSGVRIAGDISELSYAEGSEPAEPSVAEVAACAGIAARIAAEFASELAEPTRTSSSREDRRSI